MPERDLIGYGTNPPRVRRHNDARIAPTVIERELYAISKDARDQVADVQLMRAAGSARSLVDVVGSSCQSIPPRGTSEEL